MSGRDDDASAVGAGDGDESASSGFLGRWSARKRGTAVPTATDRAARATVDEVPLDATREAIVPGSGSVGASAKVPALAPNEPFPDGDAANLVPDGERGSESDATGETRVESRGAAPGPNAGVPAVSTDDAPPLTDADMPPIESLRADSDVSGFFSKGVSAALRRAALRHVFAQPAYNVRDGLNDYDGDYTVFEPLGDTITSDMKFHTARLERKRLEEERLEAERLEAERLEEERLEEERPEEERLEEERLEAGRSEAERTGEGRPEAERSEDERSAADRSVEGPSGEDRFEEERSVAERREGRRLDGERREMERPEGERAAEERPEPGSRIGDAVHAHARAGGGEAGGAVTPPSNDDTDSDRPERETASHG